MKKLLLLLLLFSYSFSDELSIEKSIYESIFTSLSKSENISVYSDSSIESLALETDKFSIVDNCKDATIVVMTKSELALECQDKIVFATRYRHLKQAYVVGAFFWQKGRPNIVFLQERIDEKGIVLSPSLEQFVE